MIRNRCVGALAGSLLLSGSILQAEPSVFYTSTVGSNHYVSHDFDAYFELPKRFYIAPNYYTYRSDFADGTFHTYGGDFGQNYSDGNWRLFGSHTPETALYGQTTAGGEITQRILGNHDHFPSRPDLSARIRYSRRMHTEVFPADTGDTRLHIHQNDYVGGLRSRWKDSTFMAAYTQSAYNENLSLLRTPSEVYQPLPGVSSVIGGYTDYAYSFSLSQKLAAHWRVWGIWTRIRLEAEESMVNSYILGLGYYGKHLSLLLDYNAYKRSAEAVRNFVSMGIGWEFNP